MWYNITSNEEKEHLSLNWSDLLLIVSVQSIRLRQKSYDLIVIVYLKYPTTKSVCRLL